MIQRIKEIIYGIRFKRAVREAKKFSRIFNMTYYVLYHEGRFKVCAKKRLKELIAQRRFKKGTTIQDIEKIALYIAKPYLEQKTK